MKLYKKLSKEDKRLLILAQSPTLIQEQISAFEWVLKDPYEEPPLKSYVAGGEIPYEISHKLEMYQGRNIHDVRATTYKLRNAYKDGNEQDIKKYTDILRKFVNGI